MGDMVVRFSGMTWEDQRDAVLGALPAVLAGLGEEPVSTAVVIAGVGAAMGLRFDLMPAHSSLVSKRLLGIAKRGHPHATHDGPEITSFGKPARAWRWWREPQSEAPAPKRGASDVAALEARVAKLERLMALVLQEIDRDAVPDAYAGLL